MPAWRMSQDNLRSPQEHRASHLSGDPPEAVSEVGAPIFALTPPAEVLLV